MAYSSRHTTSWEREGKWYKKTTAGAGNYFHEHVVIPGVRKLLHLSAASRILDLGCGTGVLGRAIDRKISYVGIDVAPSLIEEAKRRDNSPDHQYLIADVTRPLAMLPNDFTHCAIILALQNMKNPTEVIQNASKHLTDSGVLVIVLNHPSFRIPRLTSWGTDEANKLQYRRVNVYLTPTEIPVTMHPGKQNSTVTWSYHYPLSSYTWMLRSNGFLIDTIEEWSSDKKSAGRMAKMENRSRAEIPLFLTIKAVKALSQTPKTP